MKKVFNVVYILCFLLTLIIPLCLTNTESNVKSDFDNRVLVELPELGTPKYSEKIKSYLQDRIGLRDQMVTGYQLLNNFAAGELTHPSYTYGQDGYMFFKMHSNNSYGKYHKTFAEAVLKMKDYCEARGAKFYFMFDPEKISVYRRYLPVGVNYNDEWVDELLAYMEENDIKCINNRDILMDRSFEEQVFNHQYDAGHWNDLGSYYGTNNLWKVMHEDFPSVTEYTEDDYTVSYNTGKYLASSRFPVYEKVPVLSLKTGWNDISAQYSDIQRNKNFTFFRYYVNKSLEAKDYPKMLVFHGSYYIRAPKFFAGRSREYIGVHDYQNVLNLDYYFNIFQPEVVVFEVAEYTFSDYYFSSSKMAALDYNPYIGKAGEDIETAIFEAKSNAEQFVIESGSGLFVAQHDGFDTAYIKRDFPSARYVYLFAEGKVFDMQKNENNLYSTAVPHDVLKNKATLYYVDYGGNTYYSDVFVQPELSFVTGSDCFTYTNGAAYNAADDQYVFTTDIEGNKFSWINMQLLDAITGQYYGTIYSRQSTGTVRGDFIHTNKTGLYIIRLKGNTNKKDESIDVVCLLKKGEKYYYSFEVNELTTSRIKIKNYELFGPSAYLLITDPDCLTYTNGASYNANDNQYEYVTEIEDNRFNSVNMQLLNATTREYLGTLLYVGSTGSSNGSFVHEHDTGWYLIRLKGNSNKKDEAIDVLTYLVNGEEYFYSFIVNELSEKKIIIKNYNLYSLTHTCSRKKELIDQIQKSNWVEEIEMNQYKMITELEGNAFSSVVLQLSNNVTKELINPLSFVDAVGVYSGRYYHTATSGEYFLKLRANSNLKDEYVGVDMFLNQGGIYEWSYEVEKISPTEVVIKNFTFSELSSPYE